MSEVPDRRRTARLAVVATAALATSVLAPPVGVALGVVALTLALRSRDQVSTRVWVLTATAGLVAGLVGLAITTVVVIFRAEIADYSRCLSGANTLQARQNCEAAFSETVRSRLGV